MDHGGRSEKSGGGRRRCCLGFLLKLIAFLQAFAALSVVLYATSILSAFILSRWARHHELHIHHLLLDLWFACAVMAAGLLYCAIFLAGYVAAEVSSGCCVCFRLYRRISNRGCPTAVNDVERKQDLVGSSEMLVHVRGLLHPICVPLRSDLPEGFRLAVKKSKAEKDPNKPKRPPSAFFVFM
ncbi:tetraspanin-18-like [Hordeum vulgare]|nr:tetraspanin-18-like [Hordeum vulgare]